MNFIDLKQRVIAYEISNENNCLLILGQLATLHQFPNGARAVRIKQGFDAERIASFFNADINEVSSKNEVYIPISKETFKDLARSFSEVAGASLYMYSEDANQNEVPEWATDCDKGHFNFYALPDGQIEKRFHGYY